MTEHPSQPPAECRMRFAPGPILRHVRELAQPALRAEHARRLLDARVIMADYELLRHDFASLRGPALARRFPALAGLEPAARERHERRLIDAWLLRNAALISERQAQQAEVNTPIRVGQVRLPVFRPPMYGRAVVASLRHNRLARGGAAAGPLGLLDLKGAGISARRTPRRASHSNGLLALGPALGHLVHQELIDRVFAHAGAPFRTLPNYALIAGGFHVRFRDGTLTPACLQVRRAHRRMEGGGDLPDDGTPEQLVKLEVELLLRRYGITSCTAGTSIHFRRTDGRAQTSVGHDNWLDLDPSAELGLRVLYGFDAGYPRFDGVNVQTTLEIGGPVRATLVDFGQYTAPGRFEDPVLSLVADRPLRWGLAIQPGSRFWVEPDAGLVPPPEIWGTAGGPPGPGVPAHPAGESWAAPHQRCFELAAAWDQHRMSSVELRQELDAMLDAATRAWPGAPALDNDPRRRCVSRAGPIPARRHPRPAAHRTIQGAMP